MDIENVLECGRKPSRRPHLNGDVEHEARLPRVGHAHDPDAVGIAYAHFLLEQCYKT